MKTTMLFILGSIAAFGQTEAVPRIKEAAAVFEEIMSAPDKGIPVDLIEKAHCLAIIPGVKKGGFIVGAQYGKGIMTCRTGTGWSGPSTIRLEGGSFGAQIGAGETDVVLVVLNERGAQKLMNSEFTLGADAGVMAGPVGRDAAAKTDAYMRAEILSYSRARGLFAGITLNGSTLRSDDKDNAALYGSPVTHRDILTGKVAPPATAKPLYDAFAKYAPAATDTRTRTK
jgi:lipid-binding SYLF domain-containing protein